jgi:hypothetical protein
LRTLGFREGNDVSDGLCAGHHGDDAVQAKGQATMRRRSVLQGVKQEAELGLLFFRANIERLENGFLNFGFVNTHRATADFPAIECQIVGLG